MKLLLIASLTAYSLSCLGQQLVNSTGDTFSNATLTVEYSVGEIATLTLNANQQTVTQGLLQPSYKGPTGSNELFKAHYALNYYPNPVTETLHIETDFRDFRTLSIYALDGKLIRKQVFDYQDITLESLPAGSYFLTLSDEQNIYFKTLKLIKI
jgi:Secretion system C-terminal sorting domain